MGWFFRTSMGLTIEKRGFGLWPMGIQSTDMGFKQSDCRLKHLSQRSTILGDGSKALWWIHIMTLGGMNSIQKSCDEESSGGLYWAMSGDFRHHQQLQVWHGFEVQCLWQGLQFEGPWRWDGEIHCSLICHTYLDEIQRPYVTKSLGHG